MFIGQNTVKRSLEALFSVVRRMTSARLCLPSLGLRPNARSRACSFDWSSKPCSATEGGCHFRVCSQCRFLCLFALTQVALLLLREGAPCGAVSICFPELRSVWNRASSFTRAVRHSGLGLHIPYLVPLGLRPNVRSRAGTSASRLSLPCLSTALRLSAVQRLRVTRLGHGGPLLQTCGAF